jgi:hypothetical protein
MLRDIIREAERQLGDLYPARPHEVLHAYTAAFRDLTASEED